MKTDDQVYLPEFWAEQWQRTSSSAAASAGYGYAAAWNAMAEGYGRRPQPGDRDDRVAPTIAYLEGKGVRLKNARVLDIGCGPGAYAMAFARRGAKVVCLDLSEKMIARLQKETGGRERKKITPMVADWKTLDLESLGFVKAFDLTFANMTPAIAGPEAFLKIMRASRQWCWFRGWAGPRNDPLLDRLHLAVNGRPPAAFNGNFFHAWNLVCASGCFPDCSFSKVQWTEKKTLAECLGFYTLFFRSTSALPADELSQRIEACLSGVAVDGFVENTVKGRIGSMLWTTEERSR